MNRSVLVTLVAVIQLLFGLLCAGTVGYLLVLTRSKQILADKDAAEAVHGLKIGAAVVAAMAVPVLASAYGLFKRKLWAWIVALLVNVAGAVLMLWGPVLEHERMDRSDITFTAFFLVMVIVLLLPGVWRSFFSRAPESPPDTAVPRKA